MPTASASDLIRCPRCGYDQRGVVATWSESCPLQGTCSECGLRWDWVDVIDRRNVPPVWCVEFSPSIAVMPWRALCTVLMMALPWRFWLRLQMRHEFHPWPIAAMFAGLLIILLYADHIRMLYWHSGLKSYLSAFLFGGVRLAVVTQDYRSLGPSTRLVLAAITAAIMPLWFVALPMSRRLARVQWRHVWRIALYSFVPMFIFVILDLLQPFVMDLFGVSSRMRSYNVWLWSYERARLYGAVVGMPLFLLAWWSFAIHSYLRMPRATFIAAFMLLAAVLTVGLLAAISTMMSDL